MEATRSSCSESALDVCKSPEKMSKTFAKKVSKMGGKGYTQFDKASIYACYKQICLVIGNKMATFCDYSRDKNFIS